MGRFISTKNWTFKISINKDIIEIKVIKKLTGKIEISKDD
jgi:hypothetical protein